MESVQKIEVSRMETQYIINVQDDKKVSTPQTEASKNILKQLAAAAFKEPALKIKKSTVRATDSYHSGEKRFRNVLNAIAGVGFFAWLSTLPVKGVYYSTIMWIKSAADAVQPVWTVFGTVTTVLGVVTGVLGAMGAALTIRKIEEQTELSQKRPLATLEKLRDAKFVKKYVTPHVEAFKARLNVMKEGEVLEGILRGRIKSQITTQKLILISQIVGVVGSAIVLAGCPWIGLGVGLVGLGFFVGSHIHNAVRTYQFENKMGMIVRKNEDPAITGKRARVKDFVKWYFGKLPTYQVPVALHQAAPAA